MEKIEKYAVILCAGTAQRANLGFNKAFFNLGQKTILQASLDKFDDFDKILVVANGNDLQTAKNIAQNYGAEVILGGSSRFESAKNAVCHLFNSGNPDAIVVIHDGARPFASRDLIERVVESAVEYGSGVAGVAVIDSLKRAEGFVVTEAVDRDGLYAIQTPQAFLLREIFSAYALADGEYTDDGEVFRANGNELTIVEGEYTNKKMTVESDFDEFCGQNMQKSGQNCGQNLGQNGQNLGQNGQNLGRNRQDLGINCGQNRQDLGINCVQNRQDLGVNLGINCGQNCGQNCGKYNQSVGIGFDVHRLKRGRKLYLGGVKIDYKKGLLGHSDADVLLHAIADAVLSASSQPDIGVLFSDSDPKNMGMDSAIILRTAHEKLRNSGQKITFISGVIIAQKPKIAPYIKQIRQKIANILEIDPSFVNISATTTESLGIVGRGRAIASQAVCLCSPIQD